MPLKTSKDDQTTLNLTPMIDIVFLLIIFFMVGTKFSELSEAEKQIPLEVPEVSQLGTLTSAPRDRVVNIYQDGTIMLDSETVTLDSLISELKQAKTEFEDMGVTIRPDADIPAQNLANVMMACREAGVGNFGFSVRQAQNKIR